MTPPGSSREQLLSELAELQRRLTELRRRVRDPSGVETIPPGDLRLLLCRVGRERVALLQDEVEHVVMMARLTPVPEGPVWMAGLLDLHGTAVPVLDLCARLERRRRPPAVNDFIIVCRHARGRVGLVVQDVHDLFTGPRSLLQEASAEVSFAPYVLGVLQLDKAQAFIYSVARLAADTGVLEEDG